MRRSSHRWWLGSVTKLSAAVVAAAVWVGGSPSTAVATEIDPLTDLKNRIEQLERDNKELRSALRTEPRGLSGQSALPPVPDVDTDLLASLPPEPTNPVPMPGDDQLGSLVDGYMRRLTDMQRPVDAAQDKKISSLQNDFLGLKDKLSKKTFPTVQINGVFQADTGWFQQDAASQAAVGNIQDGSSFRRARLSAKGQINESMNYFFQMDFAAFGRPTFTDVWVEQKTGIPILGTVRVGQWKQPFSLEVVSSFRYTTFIDRSLLFQSFTPFRHLGVGFYNNSEDERMTWAASVFRTGQDQFGGTLTDVGGYGTAERVTYLPYWDDATKGANYLHIGAAHFFNAPPNGLINFRTIPEFFVGAHSGTAGAPGSSGQPTIGNLNGVPFFAQTGFFQVNAYNVLGTELLWVNGPLSFQSEAMVNFVDQKFGPNAVLPGCYAQVGYFLTGEHRPFDRKQAQIDRVKPFHDVTPLGSGGACGFGAWEVAARFSYLNLSDRNLMSATNAAGAAFDARGGRLTDYTVGVNWYVNAYCKVAFNYIRAVPQSPFTGSTTTDIYAVMTQLDF